MKNQEYLTEENYERGKKKIKRIALIVFLCGLLIGGGLIVTGVVKSNQERNEHSNEQMNTTRTEEAIQADIDATKEKIATLEDDQRKLRNEQSQIFQEDRGFSDRYYAKDDEIAAKKMEITKLQDELSKYQQELFETQTDFGQMESFEQTGSSIPLYMIGGFIIIASTGIAFNIYLFAKRREVLAFTAQQVMPVAQEGVEKMTPTVGKAAGSISKEIAKGIKEGINEANKENDDE